MQDIIKNSADPIADADDYPGLVGAGRVNAYQALLLAQSYLRPDTITTAITWNQKKHIYADLIIDSLATLTITDTLYIAGGSRIIVRPGGKLIVNGGTLTSACDGEMWQGIIVEGHKNIRQTELAQGSVILNNATIENARTAISTKGADTNTMYDHSGGIVQATNSLFRNNMRTAEFLSYENHKPNNSVTDNVSFFFRCSFTVDDNNLFAENNAAFENHVTLWQVRGVQFNGCSFRNETTVPTGSARGKAIYTEDAGFIAQRVCPAVTSSPDPCFCEGTPTDTITRCSFSGFFKAVHATNNSGNYNVTIDNCDFRQNQTGVELAAADNARVSFCDFDLETLSPLLGLMVDNSSGFTVESNSFHGRTSHGVAYASGIGVNNSGRSENSIRKNSFYKMNTGCSVFGVNGSVATGLQFLCNIFSSGSYDIKINDALIRGSQGAASAGADNTFSKGPVSSLYRTSLSSTFTYWHSPGTGHAPQNPSPGITLDNGASANSCSSSLCGDSIPPAPPGPLSLSPLLSGYTAMAEELATLEAEYEARGIGDPAGNDEQADNLVEQMSELSAAMGDLFRASIRTIIGDTVVDMELLKEWYRTIVETGRAPSLQEPGQQPTPVPVEAYLLAEVYSTERDWTAARGVLASIPLRFVMDSTDADEYGNYLVLQRLRENVEGNWYRQSQPEIAELQSVAEHNGGRAARMAKEILCFFHHICYEDEPLVDLEGIGERNTRGGVVHRAATTAIITGTGTFTLYPNPAHNTLTVESTSPIREITVYDMAGHAVMVETMCTSYLQQTINITSLHAGIYLLKVVTETGIETAKFVKN